MSPFVALLASLVALLGITGAGSGSSDDPASTDGEPATDAPPDDDGATLPQAAFFARDGQLVVEAENGEASGDWEEIAFDGETAMLWDADSSSYRQAPEDQAITIEFVTEESGTYTIALHGGRMRDVMNESDLREGDGTLRTDTGNDVYIRITNIETEEEVVSPTKLYVGLGNSDEDLRWGSTFDPPGGSHVSATAELEADAAYKLEVIGRSDGFALDRITLSNDGRLYDAVADESPLLTDYIAALPEQDLAFTSSSEDDDAQLDFI